METNRMQALMIEAKKFEKKYNWQNAAEAYMKAYELALKEQDIQSAAEIQVKNAYSLFRAAFQVATNKDFRRLMKHAIKAYEAAVELFKKSSHENVSEKLNNAKAMIAFAFSWSEPDFQRRRIMLDKWLQLKKAVLKSYEEKGDFFAIGQTCNDILEASSDNYIWLFRDWPELLSTLEEYISLGEKAIQVLSQVDNFYELARAYLWTGWYYAFYIWYKPDSRRNELGQKSKNYAKKALALAEKTNDAWLIGWSNNAASFSFWAYDCDLPVALRYSENSREQSAVTNDRNMLGESSMWASFLAVYEAQNEEDPEIRRKGIEKAIEWAKNAASNYQIIQNPRPIVQVYWAYVSHLNLLALLETTVETKRAVLDEAINIGRKFHFEDLKSEITLIASSLSISLHYLSKITSNEDDKKKLLEEARSYRIEYIALVRRMHSTDTFQHVMCQNFLARIEFDRARIEKEKSRKIELLNSAVLAMEETLSVVQKEIEETQLGWKNALYGDYYYSFGDILRQLYSLTKEKEPLSRASDAYSNAIKIFCQAKITTRAAESHWRLAQVYSLLGDHLKAAESYASAAKSYRSASEKIPQLKEFYEEYSTYMQAWDHIEQAKHNHIIEKYDQSRSHYEEAAQLHELTKIWRYLTSNYSAWVKMEEAEDHSRNEKTHQAKQTFQQALEQFNKAEENIRTKLMEITDPEEKEMDLRLIRASETRRKFCKARIDIEEAKILDAKADYHQSSKAYGIAAENLRKIVPEVDSEEEKRELGIIMTLCEAWQKLEEAEEQAAPETYQQAAKLFEQVKKHSRNKKTALLAQGNSSFCKGLAAGTQYQTTLAQELHSKAKAHMKTAATSYLQAGFKSASEYAKATQRLFDAYFYMNTAEREQDPEKSLRYYEMAEKVLQISAGSFTKANQPEKTAEVQRIIETVREERALAASLNVVLHAPTITSTTMSFETPTPTKEDSVGLQRFESADIQAKMHLSSSELKLGENLNLEIEFVNTGKKSALLTRVENLIPEGFMVIEKPNIYRIEDACLNMKGKEVEALKTQEVSLLLQPVKEGDYLLQPTVHFMDDIGTTMIHKPEPLAIAVKRIVLPNRVATGTNEIETLTLGGIPETYAVVLTGSPSDERNAIIRNFLEKGTRENQVVFHITGEANSEDLAAEHQKNFYLFLDDVKTSSATNGASNIYRLQGKNLTNLNIALFKAFRSLDHAFKGPKRLCIEIISDVLLREEAVVTRRWLTELLSDSKSKGFTILAMMDPNMHPQDQFHAVLNLFDGEISLYETEDPLECKKSLRVKKLRNQDYIKNPICLIKSK